jgi:hypothetical protein
MADIRNENMGLWLWADQQRLLPAAAGAEVPVPVFLVPFACLLYSEGTCFRNTLFPLFFYSLRC